MIVAAVADSVRERRRAVDGRRAPRPRRSPGRRRVPRARVGPGAGPRGDAGAAGRAGHVGRHGLDRRPAPAGVTLCNGRGSRDIPVAEWVVGAILGAATGLLASARDRRWEHHPPARGPRLAGPDRRARLDRACHRGAARGARRARHRRRPRRARRADADSSPGRTSWSTSCRSRRPAGAVRRDRVRRDARRHAVRQRGPRRNGRPGRRCSRRSPRRACARCST